MGQSKSKRPKIKSRFSSSRLTGWLSILLGILVIINVLFYPNITDHLSAQTPIMPSVYPTVINIDQSSSIPVQIGHYRQSEWDLTTDRAMYLYGSGTIGESGNAIIYGHNTDQVFAKLYSVKPGDNLKVLATNGKTLTYQVQKTLTVNPNQVEILQPTSHSQLTIFTCSGWFNESRFVVIANLVSS